MENKHVGSLILGIAIVMAILVLMFNTVLKDNLDLTCSHGPTCEMYSSLKVQTWISLSIVAVVAIIGLVIMFSKPKEKIIFKKVKEKSKKIDLSKLDKDEKKVIELLQQEGKAIFQASLMEKLEIGKVKATRLLDKLESKGLIERKRRGMNNIVVLKD
ncbi:MAG: MarR family transcriptional regulator [archaeon]